MGEESIKCLLDTGSSISLMSKEVFDGIKNKIKYRFLGRTISISTINSQVQFRGCADISFKINKQHFRHNIYLSTISENSPFTAILGYDFISKYNILIFPDNGCCKLGNEIIYFNNHKPKSNQILPEAFTNTLEIENISIEEKENDEILESSELTKFIDAKPFVPRKEETKSTILLNVLLSEKMTIGPGQQVYGQAHVKLPQNFLNRDIIFNPRIDDHKIKAHSALYHFHADGDRDKYLTEPKAQTQPLPSDNEKFAKSVNIYIYMENLLDTEVRINKNYQLGSIDEVEATDPDKDQNENLEIINVITANTDTIKLREKEFKEAKINLEHLEEKQQQQLYSLLEENYQAFSGSLKSLGHTDVIVPEIKFTTDYPIKALPFPVPQALHKEVKNQIDEMVEAGIIEKNVATWACPMILVKKKPEGSKQEKFRMTLDLRLLNAVIQHSSYPLPKIQEIISNIAEYKYFTLLDMPSAYHQVDLPEKFQDRICFTSPFGTYKLKRMPQGLKTSAGHFQALADSLVEETNLPGIFDYIDDFIVCSNSFEETIAKLNKLLQVFKKHNLTLNLAKCNFHTTEVNYLGFKITNHRISPISANILKIKSFPAPKSKRHIKKFLGLCGFYRNLIPSYAEIADPLVRLTSPSRTFKWEEAEENAFQQLQEIFFKDPFLRKPDFNKTFYLNTDASAFAISAVLLQKFEDNLLPVAYFSKALRKAETRYPAIQQELMAIIKGISAFRYILYGRQFVILSDSKPLDKYKKTSSPAGIITRWLMELAEYQYIFQHIPGKQNVLADFLSRTPVTNNSSNLNDEPNLINAEEILPIIEDNNSQHQFCNAIKEKQTLDIEIEEILEQQSKDKFIQEVIKDLKEKGKNTIKFKNYMICSSTNLLLFIRKPNKTNNQVTYKIVIPQALKEKCLKINHFTHLGIDKTFQNLERKYFWRGMYSDVINYVKSCTKCLTIKPQRVPVAPFQKTLIPSRPGQLLSLDFVGPFSNGQHILTVIDHFSKHFKLYPLKKITAMNAVHAIFDYIVTFGRPEMILSDNGSQFKANIFQEFNKMLGINLKHTTTSHPEANSVSERINFSIKATVKSLMSEGYNFENAVKIHESIYNSSFHTTIKCTPNKVHFGRNLPNITDSFNPDIYQQRLDVHEDYYTLMENLKKLYDKVHGNLITSQQIQNDKQHQKAKLRKFQVGDLVLVDDSNRFKRASKGPFKVIEQCSEVIYKIQIENDPQARIQKIHINRLMPIIKRREHLKEKKKQVTNSENNQGNTNSPLQENIQDNLILTSKENPNTIPVILDIQEERITTGEEQTTENQPRYNLRSRNRRN